jgi:outer membrane protein TolC
MISAKHHTIRLSMQLVLAGVGLMGIGAVLGPVASAAEAPVQDAALPAISRSLQQHPDVTAANARVCQAIHRLGLSRAQSRPQISLSISGGRQLLERIKGQNGGPDRRRFVKNDRLSVGGHYLGQVLIQRQKASYRK